MSNYCTHHKVFFYLENCDSVSQDELAEFKWSIVCGAPEAVILHTIKTTTTTCVLLSASWYQFFREEIFSPTLPLKRTKKEDIVFIILASCAPFLNQLQRNGIVVYFLENEVNEKSEKDGTQAYTCTQKKQGKSYLKIYKREGAPSSFPSFFWTHTTRMRRKGEKEQKHWIATLSIVLKLEALLWLYFAVYYFF